VRSARSLAVRWVAACSVGEVVGLAVAAGATVGMTLAGGDAPSLGWRILTLAVVGAGGAVEGLAVGLAQAWALRPHLPGLPTGPWVGATVVVAVMLWLAASVPAKLLAGDGADADGGPGTALTLVLAAVLGTVAGLLFGGAQAWVLRRAAMRVRGWVGANAAGWAAAMVWIFAWAGGLPEGAGVGAALAAGAGAGVGSGLLVGAITGVAVVRLRPRVPPILGA
jgi:hypothetical protein